MSGEAAYQRFFPTPSREAQPIARVPGVLAILLLSLPIYMQVFQYLKDIRAVWAFAKISPLLLLPVTVFGLVFLKLPYRALWLLLMIYLLLVGPMLSMLYVDASFLEAAGSTVKIWAFAFYFTAGATFLMLRVSEEKLSRALMILAVANFATLWILWIVMPDSTYVTDITLTGMFLWDQERGPRIMLPLVFGLLGLVWMARSFSVRPSVWQPALIVLCFTLMFVIYKQRTVIGFSLLMVLWAATGEIRRRLPLFFWAGCALAVAGVIALVPFLSELLGSSVRDSLGGSLTVREESGRLLTAFLEQRPERWLFGMGGTTEFNTIQLPDFFRKRDFFLADLGWLGTIGEYGLVGSVLIAACYACTLREAARAASLARTPFRLALQDLTMVLILVTAFYSVTYTPGQIATVMAIVIYLQSLPIPPPPPARPGVVRPAPHRHGLVPRPVAGRG